MKNYKFIDSILNKEDRDLIAEEIGKQEKSTSGEIRVSIKRNRGILNTGKSLRQIAVKEFRRLKMFNTRDRSGILLFMLLKERSFYIFADSGISEKIEQNVWDKIAGETETFFREGNFRVGIIHTISECGKILQKHFPVKSDDTNELDNSIEIS